MTESIILYDPTAPEAVYKEFVEQCDLVITGSGD